LFVILIAKFLPILESDQLDQEGFRTRITNLLNPALPHHNLHLHPYPHYIFPKVSKYFYIKFQPKK